MAWKTSSVVVRVSAKEKKEIWLILQNLWLTWSSAINIYLKQIKQKWWLPFQVTTDTKEKAIHDTINNVEANIDVFNRLFQK